ncbi:polysaccharide biosynthesis protein [Candidatus Hydrogenedentota bacterium]
MFLSHYRIRRFLTIIADAACLAIAYYAAFALRLEERLTEPKFIEAIVKTIVPAVAVQVFILWLWGCYKALWRFAGIRDLKRLLGAVGTFAIVHGFSVLVIQHKEFLDYPRTVVIINTFLVVCLCGGLRFSVRLARDILRQREHRPAAKRTLIIGAGGAGETVVREMLNNPVLGHKPVGFVDDNPGKLGRMIHGVPVVGTTTDIPKLAVECDAEEILIAIPTLRRERLRDMVELCEQSGVKFKSVPAVADLIDGSVSVEAIREIQIEDVLGREQIEIDSAGVGEYLRSKRVLITGAGGSIGSELCRQVMGFSPAQLALFGRGENSIYQIHSELKFKYPKVEFPQITGDVINKAKLRHVFDAYRPEIVFHAGASKHVHLSEINCDEAVFCNVIGTSNVLDVSEESGVERVVCVSTDKAVRPHNIMGCTKRVAEMLVAMRRHEKTVCTCVRFGNVLGSRGSVVPLFREQIARGGPVTVTHKDMTRFFMTIPEAAQLVLQAGCYANGGEIFVLDMGDPVPIVDLARDMIRLSGFEPDRDIQIEYVGIRPGEKLDEALVGPNEELEDTPHPKICRVVRNGAVPEVSPDMLKALERLAIDMDFPGLVARLAEIVPEFDYYGPTSPERPNQT